MGINYQPQLVSRFLLPTGLPNEQVIRGLQGAIIRNKDHDMNQLCILCYRSQTVGFVAAHLTNIFVSTFSNPFLLAKTNDRWLFGNICGSGFW